jgi:hypothetical protein
MSGSEYLTKISRLAAPAADQDHAPVRATA